MIFTPLRVGPLIFQETQAKQGRSHRQLAYLLIEPKNAPTMSVVGIDFGNQNAVIAAAGRGGVDVILNGNSNRLNP